MLPVIVAVVAGAVVGACRRPLGAHLDTPRLQLPGLAVAAFAVQAVGALAGLPAEGWLLALSLGLLTVFARWNLHLVGMGVLMVGLGLNTLAVAIHGAMPVRATALLRSGAAAPGTLADVDLGFGRRFERTSDLAPWLGDALPAGWFGAAMSFGDLIALAGIAAVSGELVRYARRGSRWSLTTTAARLAHDWGLAPSPSPVSGSQYSAQPEAAAPATSAAPTVAGTDDTVISLDDDPADDPAGDDDVSRPLVAASHDR